MSLSFVISVNFISACFKSYESCPIVSVFSVFSDSNKILLSTTTFNSLSAFAHLKAADSYSLSISLFLFIAISKSVLKSSHLLKATSKSFSKLLFLKTVDFNSFSKLKFLSTTDSLSSLSDSLSDNNSILISFNFNNSELISFISFNFNSSCVICTDPEPSAVSEFLIASSYINCKLLTFSSYLLIFSS